MSDKNRARTRQPSKQELRRELEKERRESEAWQYANGELLKQLDEADKQREERRGLWPFGKKGGNK